MLRSLVAETEGRSAGPEAARRSGLHDVHLLGLGEVKTSLVLGQATLSSCRIESQGLKEKTGAWEGLIPGYINVLKPRDWLSKETSKHTS